MNRPLRILHTNMLRGWGGQSNRILTESLAVARGGGGHEVVLALPHGSELGRRARAAGLRVEDEFTFRGPGKPLAFLRDIRNLKQILTLETWDILHLHGSPDTWVAAFALSGVKSRPAVVRTRHNIFPIARHRLNAWLYGRHVDGLIGISRAIQRQCAEIPFLASKPTALIWSVPDVDRFGATPPGTRERVRQALDTPPDTPVVLCAGRLRPEKGQDILIQAVPAIRRTIPGLQLWIAGDGSKRAEYERLAQHLGVGDTVRFLGLRSDVPDLMAAADLDVVPSRSEGLGTAALEALAAGRAVVASDVGGLPDSILPGRTGLLVPPENPDALAEAIVGLLRDPAQRDALGRAGRKLIEEQFTEAALARRTLEFYHELGSRTR